MTSPRQRVMCNRDAVFRARPHSVEKYSRESARRPAQLLKCSGHKVFRAGREHFRNCILVLSCDSLEKPTASVTRSEHYIKPHNSTSECFGVAAPRITISSLAYTFKTLGRPGQPSRPSSLTSGPATVRPAWPGPVPT